MVISDENETEGCHYAEVSGLDTKKRQPEKVTVACPVFPLTHGQFNAVSALAAAVDGKAGGMADPDEGTCAMDDACNRGHRQCKYASCPTTERFSAVHGHSDAVSVQYAFVVIHCDIWFCSSSPSLIEGKSRRVTGGFFSDLQDLSVYEK